MSRTSKGRRRNAVVDEYDPNVSAEKSCPRPSRGTPGSGRTGGLWKRRRLVGVWPEFGGRPAAAGVGRQRRLVAGPQLRPRKHTSHHAHTDQLADGLAAEGEVALPVQGCERVRRLRVNPDRHRRHCLSARPELERLRARPVDRQGQVAARIQQAKHRPERCRLRQRQRLRRHRRRRPLRWIPRPGSCSGAAS